MLAASGIIFVLLFVSICAHGGIAPPYYGLDRPALEYELPPLPYGFDELEPYIDEETVRNHYLGHHARYAENMNWDLKEWRKYLREKHISRISIIDILRNMTRVPEKYREGLRNNGGGFVSHALYWSVMSPNPTDKERVPEATLFEDINQRFHSYQEFKDEFTEVANNLHGSGYVWLCRNKSDTENPTDLAIVGTANHNSPLSNNLWPILGIDLWEHAYYLKHQNKHSRYINDWWFLVDWQQVHQLDRWWAGAKLHDEL